MDRKDSVNISLLSNGDHLNNYYNTNHNLINSNNNANGSKSSHNSININNNNTFVPSSVAALPVSVEHHNLTANPALVASVNTNGFQSPRHPDTPNNFVIEVYNLDKMKTRSRDRVSSSKLDTFICGLCNKVYHKLLDILEHKLQHVSPNTKVSCSVCSTVFSRQMSLREHYRRQHKIFLGKAKGNSKPPCIIPRLNHRKVSLLTRELEPYQELVKSECPNVIVMDPFVDKNNGDGSPRISLPQPISGGGHGATNILMVQQGDTEVEEEEEEEENRRIVGSFSLPSRTATTITTTATAADVVSSGVALSRRPQLPSIQQKHDGAVVLADPLRLQLSGSVGVNSHSRKACGSAEGVVRMLDMEIGDRCSSSNNNNSSSSSDRDRIFAVLSMTSHNGNNNSSSSRGDDGNDDDDDDDSCEDIVLVHSVGDSAGNISLMDSSIIDSETTTTTRVIHSLQEEEEDDDEDEDEDNDNDDDEGEEEEEEVVINMSKELINLSEHFDNSIPPSPSPSPPLPPPPPPPPPSLPSVSLDITAATFSEPASAAVEQRSSSNDDDDDDDDDADDDEEGMGPCHAVSVSLPGHGLASAMPSRSGSAAAVASPRPDFTFVLVTNIVRGNSFTYGKQSFKCVHCPFRTHWKNSMMNHMRDKHPEVLSRALSSSAAELSVVAIGDNQRLMKMSEYNRSMVSRFKTRTSSTNKRVRGVEKQDLLGSYPCSKCPKVFNRLRYLRKHTQIHRTDAMFFCEVCGKGFKTRTYLAAHERTHKKGAYRCRQCGFTSKINAAIHAHRQLHNEGSVICDICGFAYTDKSTLNKHKRVHDPVRPFACTFPGCTWRFKTDVMCQAHFRAHTTQGKFRCSVCGYLFRHKHHLQRHELKMHGVQQTKSRLPKPTATTTSVVTEGSLMIAAPVAAKTTTTAAAATTTAALAAGTNTLSLIVDPDDVVVAGGNHIQLEAALHNGQQQQHHLVITAECQGETIDYDMSDVTMMNVAYRSLLQDAETSPTSVGVGTSEHHPQAILIPQSHCGQVIFQTAGLESV